MTGMLTIVDDVMLVITMTTDHLLLLLTAS